jgi:hypothetical protein
MVYPRSISCRNTGKLEGLEIWGKNNPIPPFHSSIFPHELEFLCGKIKESQYNF